MWNFVDREDIAEILSGVCSVRRRCWNWVCEKLSRRRRIAGVVSHEEGGLSWSMDGSWRRRLEWGLCMVLKVGFVELEGRDEASLESKELDLGLTSLQWIRLTSKVVCSFV